MMKMTIRITVLGEVFAFLNGRKIPLANALISINAFEHIATHYDNGNLNVFYHEKRNQPTNP